MIEPTREDVVLATIRSGRRQRAAARHRLDELDGSHGHNGEGHRAQHFIFDSVLAFHMVKRWAGGEIPSPEIVGSRSYSKGASRL